MVHCQILTFLCVQLKKQKNKELTQECLITAHSVVMCPDFAVHPGVLGRWHHTAMYSPSHRLCVNSCGLGKCSLLHSPPVKLQTVKRMDEG